ncbi:hypothetical protein MIR68_005873 [Amoeboaphelidium protococcarum]|nr:hypothetical protein MIR68_005873 [Amoeboaphelidium protococcarum]
MEFCSTGLNLKQRDQLSELCQRIEKCSISTNLTTSTTHLVCGCTDSQKYRVAVDRRITLISHEFFDYCAETFNDEQKITLLDLKKVITKFNMKPFDGLIICVTGISETDRNNIEHLVVGNGGQFSKNLTLQCTHLVSADPKSKKHLSALEHGIFVVSPQWIQACLSAGGRLLESDYPPSDLESDDKVFPGLNFLLMPGFTKMQIDALTSIVTQCGGFISTDARQNPDYVLCSQKEIDQSHIKWQSGEAVHYSFVVQCQKQNMLLNPAIFRVKVVDLNIENVDIQQQSAIVVENSRSNNNYNSSLILKKKPVTSVQELSQLFGMGDGTSSQQSIQSSRVNSSQRQSVGSQSGFKDLKSALKLQRVNSFSKVSEEKTESSQSQTKIFAGLSFTIEGFTEKQQLVLRKAIESSKGNISDSADYLVCPYTATARKDCSQQPPSIVTELWIEACLDSQKLLSPHSFPLYNLLSISFPMQELKDVQISISGFDGLKRVHLIKLIKHLGAQANEKFSKNVHYLLCAQKDGIKYEKALEWNIPVVDEVWLINIANTGIVQHQSSSLDSQFKPAFSSSELKHQAISIPCKSDRKNRAEYEIKEQVQEDIDNVYPQNISHQDMEDPKPELAVDTSQKSNQVLSGVLVSISSKLIYKESLIKNLCRQLGAQYLGQGFSPVCTHFIHQSSRRNETFKDFKLATKQGKFIVSPLWLQECLQRKLRVKESSFPHSCSQSSLRLELERVQSSPSAKIQALSFKASPLPNNNASSMQSKLSVSTHSSIESETVEVLQSQTETKVKSSLEVPQFGKLSLPLRLTSTISHQQAPASCENLDEFELGSQLYIPRRLQESEQIIGTPQQQRKRLMNEIGDADEITYGQQNRELGSEEDVTDQVPVHKRVK